MRTLGSGLFLDVGSGLLMLWAEDAVSRAGETKSLPLATGQAPDGTANRYRSDLIGPLPSGCNDSIPARVAVERIEIGILLYALESSHVNDRDRLVEK